MFQIDVFEKKFSNLSLLVGAFTIIPYFVFLVLMSTDYISNKYLGFLNIFSMSFIFISQYRFFPHNYNSIGSLEIMGNDVSIKNEKCKKDITLGNNTSIKLKTVKIVLLFPLKKVYIKEIEFISELDTEKAIIILKNKRQVEQFKKILEDWYKSEINIKEFSQTGGRSFLFKENLKYAEIQKIKSAYNIQW